MPSSPQFCGNSELRSFQVFAGSPLFGGEVPQRPQLEGRLGLDDEVWNKIRSCLNFRPKRRPAIKDVRSFLEPLHQRWIPPAPEGAANSNTAHSHNENDSYVDFTCYSDGTVPSRPPSTTGISIGDTPLVSGESPGTTLSPEPALVSARTRKWVQTHRSDSFPKTSRPGVTFEENPVIFSIQPRSEHWTHLL
jgi:hypothetical protein